jgi:ribosomal protein S18 acetylase RimI-like enzyme
MTTNGEAPNRQFDAPKRTPEDGAVSGCRAVTEWKIVGRARLDGGDRSNVDGLRKECEAAEPLDLKIELDEADQLDRPIHFLAVAGDGVIGYGGVTAGEEAESCGMVHPSWRRRGVGTALLDAVRTAASGLGRESILVICEDAGPAALAWMDRLGAVVESAERRMVTRLTAPDTAHHRAGAPLDVRPATDADHENIVAVIDEEYTDYPDERRLAGIEGDTIVGTLRLTESPRRTMIYGFVIAEFRRGQRLGTRMLATVLDQLRAEGAVEVGLEVDPDNTPAVRLYEAYGFKTVTTYRYMRLALTPPAHRDPSQAPERRAGDPSPEA